MVSVYLTDVEGLSRKDFDLKADSRGMKITGRFDNPTSNSMNWVGHFTSEHQREGNLILKISKGKKWFNKGKETSIEFPVFAGKNHFIDIEPSENILGIAKEAA